MKDYSREGLESSRPSVGALDAVNFCLECLYKDEEKTLNDFVAWGMSFEELVGALLVARDGLEKAAQLNNELTRLRDRDEQLRELLEDLMDKINDFVSQAVSLVPETGVGTSE